MLEIFQTGEAIDIEEEDHGKIVTSHSSFLIRFYDKNDNVVKVEEVPITEACMNMEQLRRYQRENYPEMFKNRK